jgi:hypothetical protein
MRRNCAADGGASVPSAGWAPVDDGGRPDAAPPETPASVGGELPGPVGVPEGAATVETADEPTPLGGGVADGPLPNAPPAAALAAAAALAVAAADAACGGDGLPGIGKGPPVELPPTALAPAGFRAGLELVLIKVEAKSSPLPTEFTELDEAALPNCAGSDGSGVCETGGVAFISYE